jgi:molybdenum cofactor cytidylyltransferase
MDTGRPVPPDSIFAVLMASGFSKRFGGGNKLLVPFRGKPLARYTLELVCAMDCFCGIFLVYADEQVAALAEGLPVTPIRNTAPENGQRESVRLGVEAADAVLAGSREPARAELPAEDAYYLFLPCDQPLLDADTLRRILDARRSGYIVEPRFHQQSGGPACRGSPGLFSAAFRTELLSLKEGEQPRIIKSRHPELIIPAAITNSLALTDIDEPEDLPRLAAYS